MNPNPQIFPSSTQPIPQTFPSNEVDPEMAEELNAKTIQILEGQLAGSSIYIIVLIISIAIIYNQILIRKGKEPIMDTDTVIDLNLLNRIVILILVLYFLYTSYETIKIAEAEGRDTTYLNLQFIASLLAVVSAIIVLYVSLAQSGKGRALVPLSTTENPVL